jgi:hypothetical protein
MPTEPDADGGHQGAGQLPLEMASRRRVGRAVHDAADATLRIPMARSLRSLNVAVAAAMVLGEALRQTGGFPPT